MNDEAQTDNPTIEMTQSLFGSKDTPWQDRLALVVQTVKELSGTSDPRVMMDVFGERVGGLLQRDQSMSLTRRELPPRKYRIARYSGWSDEERPDPWTEQHKLPVLEGGILGDILYGDEPVIFNDLVVPEDDPAYPYLKGMHSLIGMAIYDHGESLNMNVLLSAEPGSFSPELLPELIWSANLFGRAIHNLRVGEDLQEAYRVIDHEMKVVSGIQHSLLPQSLPAIPTMELAVDYRTAQRAGGDYYDFFPLPDGRWGILVADVCGHGPAAAVLMAITHTIAHTNPAPDAAPEAVLNYLNDHLFAHYTKDSRTFVTALYGVYDPNERSLTYSCAGHEPPHIRHADGSIEVPPLTGNLPLGVESAESYGSATVTFQPGDTVLFLTDGIFEARNPAGELFGLERLDALLAKDWDSPESLKRALLAAVDAFTGSQPIQDDQTLLVARIS